MCEILMLNETETTIELRVYIKYQLNIPQVHILSMSTIIITYKPKTFRKTIQKKIIANSLKFLSQISIIFISLIQFIGLPIEYKAL